MHMLCKVQKVQNDARGMAERRPVGHREFSPCVGEETSGAKGCCSMCWRGVQWGTGMLLHARVGEETSGAQGCCSMCRRGYQWGTGSFLHVSERRPVAVCS